MRAIRAQQLKILEIAAVDMQLLRLEQQLKKMPEQEQVAQLREQLRAAVTMSQKLEEENLWVKKDAERIESDIAMVTARSASNEEHLKTADAKLSQRLLAEQEQLLTRRAKLDTKVTENITQQESLEQQQAQSKTEQKELEQQLKDAQQSLQQRRADIERELSELSSNREGLRAEITSDLLSEYERIRARNGIGAAEFKRGISGASNMKLSPGAIMELKNAAPDEICYCPDTGAILVRVD